LYAYDGSLYLLFVPSTVLDVRFAFGRTARPFL
jgi:hypothetical protein